MTEFVRVKLENGAEATLSREFAEAKNLDILEDKVAVDARGTALPDKPHVTLAPADGPYAGMGKDDLQAEADGRGLTVEGTGANGNVTKADLLSALTAHDDASVS